MSRNTSSPIRGVMPIVPTPFLEDEAVDEPSLRRLVDHYIEAGAHGLTVLGVVGEFHKLDDTERRLVLDVALDQACGRVPIVVGTGHPSTRVAVRLSREAKEAGAVAVLVLPPYVGARPGSDDLVAYFAAIAGSISIPLVVLDEPTFSLVDLPTPLLLRIAETAGVKCVKVEQVPTATKMGELREHGIESVGGNGGLYFLEELEQGASGIMTGFGFIEVLVDVFDAWDRGDHRQATSIFYRYLPLIRYETQQVANLPLRKQVLHWRGLITTPTVRAPAGRLNEATKRQFRSLIERMELELTPSHPYRESRSVGALQALKS